MSTNNDKKHSIVYSGTHRQYYDVTNTFKLNVLSFKDYPYLFNGDFFDRGSFSVEVVPTYFFIKIACPDGHVSRLICYLVTFVSSRSGNTKF